MKIGVTALNGRFAIEPKEVRSLSALAEEIGFHSWWAADHLVLPSPQTPESPLAPSTSFTDPLIHLAFVAAATSQIRLGTGVLVLPQREPIALAKQLASLSVLSGGRFTFGLGAGYVDGELAALGVRMSERGDRLDDYLDAMNSLWTSDPATHRGTYTSFEGVAAYPRPECMRLAVGGHSRRAFRRAVARGDS
ncbi:MULTISPECIES: TIGR03619 family F420-dependent LLM class oxidoreductase [unclassified Rhodococcus (in: high G+C Gram-positive bacteria)]|uniref:TIGR03619 family F420-dependent LLM class oxidoreductase n=1 Tax=unclassified Rhodococcus (in: high G+C Gram-positive bacteria) TaxID=192944 RepID=UPI0007BB7DE8|nr:MULTISPECIES: TIGR03619 family F420-dependent LLM class oxidoreductase [unclassified Rhodococcus (in: high G+C Gram-positive bacteria)]KZE98241.1 hypothetical protein A2J02_12900 [Rhodococcus sp. EPR-147]KZF06973.1 hypothetical protein A2J04_03840 [Rhodococcus sp. EPR-279]